MLAHRTLPSLLAPDSPGCRAGVAMWMRCWPGAAAQCQACGAARQRWNLPVWHLEDGLLRSLAKGRRHPPLCLLVDDLGVHFDATAPAAWSSGSLRRSRTRSRQRAWRCSGCGALSA